VEAEIRSQPAFLAGFLREDLPRAPPGSVFCGAGDSFAAAMIAARLSRGNHVAAEPYELVLDPSIARGRTVYFVSASGRTASNLTAAKAVEGMAEERVAVMANPSGGLLEAVDSAIFLPYRGAPRLPGTLSFSLSLLALVRLASASRGCDFRRAYSAAERGAAHVLLSSGGTTWFLGNGPAFPAAAYSALKVNEVLGWRSQHAMLEEFGHAPVFSLQEGDTVNVFQDFDPLGLGRRVSISLRRLGFESAALPAFGGNPLESVFRIVFQSQLAVVTKAADLGLTRPYFSTAKAKLALSDRMIY